MISKYIFLTHLNLFLYDFIFTYENKCFSKLFIYKTTLHPITVWVSNLFCEKRISDEKKSGEQFEFRFLFSLELGNDYRLHIPVIDNDGDQVHCDLSDYLEAKGFTNFIKTLKNSSLLTVDNTVRLTFSFSSQFKKHYWVEWDIVVIV